MIASVLQFVSTPFYVCLKPEPVCLHFCELSPLTARRYPRLLYVASDHTLQIHRFTYLKTDKSKKSCILEYHRILYTAQEVKDALRGGAGTGQWSKAVRSAVTVITQLQKATT